MLLPDGLALSTFNYDAPHFQENVLLRHILPADREALELGRLALRDGRLEVAVRHLREALLLDGRMESARQLLADLGEGSRIVKRSRGRRAAMRGLLGRVRKGR